MCRIGGGVRREAVTTVIVARVLALPDHPPIGLLDEGGGIERLARSVVGHLQ
jgi:hypothetical protein